MKNSCYTFILEYKGGTYISQTNNSGLIRACKDWLYNLNIESISGLEKKVLKSEVLDIDNPPVLLEGLINVWCISGEINQNFFLINIIKTQVG